jgi:polynucleotide 5'-hydroxyl-kinase GRC3/NOL9
MKLNIKKGDFYLLNGPAKVTVESGQIECIAAPVTKDESVTVPVGKKVPLLGIKASKVSINGKEDQVTKLENSTIPSEWDVLASDIAKEKEKGKLYKILVLGEVDTGKTFFSTYLANRLLSKIGKTAILDTDCGQSDIGCPGCFGMLVLKKPEVFLTDLEPTHQYMIGAHSSGLHFVPALSGLIHMLKKAENDADVLIIDTTGWVQFDGGRAIKKAKLDMVNPDKVVLMQRGNELEHLVKHLPAEKVVRLPVSKKASSTSQMDRKALRELVSRRYFKGSKEFKIPFKQVFTDRCYLKTGTKLSLPGALWAEKLSGFEGTLVVTDKPVTDSMKKKWPKNLGFIRNFVAGNEKGILTALLDENQDVLAVARLVSIDFEKEKFVVQSTYNGDKKEIKGIQFGSLKVTKEGNEAGFIEPGSF